MSEQNRSPKNDKWELEIVEIPDPCSVPWDSMKGSDSIRFCNQCQKNVYNISSMSEAAAKSILIANEGGVCISMLKRADGTVITDSCPRIFRPVRDIFKRLFVWERDEYVPETNPIFATILS